MGKAKYKIPNVTTSYMIPADMRAIIDETASILECKRSDIVVKALDQYFQKNIPSKKKREEYAKKRATEELENLKKAEKRFKDAKENAEQALREFNKLTGGEKKEKAARA